MSAVDLLEDSGRGEIELPFARVIRSFVSGYSESERIRIKYFITPGDPILYGKVWFGSEAEGPPGHVHGGAQAAVLDEMCGGVAWTHGNPVLAATLKTDFIESVPLNVALECTGEVKKIDGRKVYTEAVIKKSAGEIYARAQGLFIILEQAQLKKLGLLAGGNVLLQDMHAQSCN